MEVRYTGILCQCHYCHKPDKCFIILCRWLLLDFKREFTFEDSIRIFEVLGTHYLELTSDKALQETDKAIAKEFELEGGCVGVGVWVCGYVVWT